MKKVVRIVVLVGLLLTTGLLFVQFVGSETASGAAEKQRFAENVNLALRRTADQLLRATGDSISRIEPVQQPDANTFRLRFDRSFDYDQLPALLQNALKIHGISTPYDVAVLDCSDGKIVLGYAVTDVTKPQTVPCRGREQTTRCYTLQVRFVTAEPRPQAATAGWMLVFGSLLAALVFTVWHRSTPTADANPPEDGKEEAKYLSFGNSRLDVTNLGLVSGSSRHQLTYREAKLLRLFAEHPNQLLERDFILKAVWEDEGIIVGRSVDVFVSRLRKLLQEDSTLRIVAVHGVGYRLETRISGPADRPV
ncbi:helix-turn-helix domain-containing protein [Larkinella bovis]|uniref:Helix-turn-helix domain-containing protein n=1 Tax=Larkinella bovis TaxID=683041 RepID=A0ABW0IAD2_9BACT